MNYSFFKWNLLGFKVSKTRNKKYDAYIESVDKKHIKRIPFGDTRYESYGDKTGFNRYKIHEDEVRRMNYRKRNYHFVKPGYFSQAYFAYYYLW